MSNNNPETQNSPATGGLPLRGLAMVLIAVAVLLGLWGLYSLTQDGEDPTQTAESSNTSDSTPAESGANGANNATPDANGDADRDTPVEESAREDAEDADSPSPGDTPEAGEGERQPEAAESRDRDAAPAGTASGKPADTPKLNVLNNSTVPQLAATVSEQLNDEGYELGEVGNFADEIFPETTVFFHPDNPEAEQEARELASRLGGVARVYKDTLPDETGDTNDLTLVLVKEVIL